jgi:hypothetical protein
MPGQNHPAPNNNPPCNNQAPQQPAHIPNAAAGNVSFFNQPANGNEELYDPNTRGDNQAPVYPRNPLNQQPVFTTEDSFTIVSAIPYNGPSTIVAAQNQVQGGPDNSDSFQEVYP